MAKHVWIIAAVAFAAGWWIAGQQSATAATSSSGSGLTGLLSSIGL